ncbi:hypothetical protein FOZ62_018552, partial [Perkinsus olseni]
YFELSTAFPVTKLRGKRDRTLKTFFLAVLPMMQRFARQLCTTSVPRLTFGSGPAVLAKALFDKYTDVDMMVATPLDPRGMRASELKRKLKNLPGFQVRL